MHSDSISIYLHVPFCTSKCTYCAFNTYINLERLIPAFVQALIKEIRIVGQNNPYPQVDTIYFGGGTPSLLSSEQFKQILNAVFEFFNVGENAEITAEVNPNDVTEDYLHELYLVGINRLSIGMQSASNQELKFFARRHDGATVSDAVKMARNAGFDNLSLDLIYGFPYQTLDSWQHSVDFALSLQPEHISMYALGLEAGTPLHDWVHSGQVPNPDDDVAADLYDLATEVLDRAGYQQYEISNWAQPGLACKHNLQYWRNLPYVGLGPGAHGYANGIRYSTELLPQRYIERLISGGTAYDFPLTPAVVEFTQLSSDDEIAETLITGLRLLQEGIQWRVFEQRFGIDLLQLHGNTLRQFATEDLLVLDDIGVRLTKHGRLLSNRVFRELV